MDLQREELGGRAGDWRRKRRRGRVWVTPLCGSFCCHFLSPINVSRHKLKVTVTFWCPEETLKHADLPNVLIYLLYSLSYLIIYLFNTSASALCYQLLNSESKPYVCFPAMCTDLWIRQVGCVGQRKGRCSMNTVCASCSIIKSPHMGWYMEQTLTQLQFLSRLCLVREFKHLLASCTPQHSVCRPVKPIP